MSLINPFIKIVVSPTTGWTFGWTKATAGASNTFTTDKDGNAFLVGPSYMPYAFHAQEAPDGIGTPVAFRNDGSTYAAVDPLFLDDIVSDGPGIELVPDPARPGRYLRHTLGVAGDNNLTRAQLRAMTWDTVGAPKRVYITEQGWAGNFLFDASDSTTPDDNGLVLVTASGKRYKRVMEGGGINPLLHFGAKGDGVPREKNMGFTIVSDWFCDFYKGLNFNPANDWCDTYALQMAAIRAGMANDPDRYGVTNSPATRFSNILEITHSYFQITERIPIRGSMTVKMDGAGSYGGTRIQQITPGEHVFHQYADTDGVSSAVSYFNGILRGGVGTHNVNTAAIFCGSHDATQAEKNLAAQPNATKRQIWTSWSDANNHSTRINGTWGQGQEAWFLILERGDDPVLDKITLDVEAWNGVRVGSQTGKVTNLRINGGTFYDVRAGAIQLINVDGFTIQGVHYYQNSGIKPDYFVEAGGGVLVKNGKILNCFVDGAKKFARFDQACQNISVEGNQQINGIGIAVEIGGGAVPKSLKVRNNSFSGDYSGTVQVGETTFVPAAPIFGWGTGATGCWITGNTMEHTGPGTAATPIYFPDPRTLDNKIRDNTCIGFADQGRIVNGLRNGTLQSYSYQTSGWNTSQYNQVVPNGLLQYGKSYALQYWFRQDGNTYIAGACLISGMLSSASPSIPDSVNVLAVNYINFPNDSAHFNLRYRKGDGTYGIEASPSVNGLNGTLSFTLKCLTEEWIEPGVMAEAPTTPPSTTPWTEDTDDGDSLQDVPPAGTENCSNYRKITPAENQALPQVTIYEYLDADTPDPATGNSYTVRAFASRAEAMSLIPGFGTQGNKCYFDSSKCTSASCQESATLYNDNRPEHISEGSNTYWPVEAGWWGYDRVAPMGGNAGHYVIFQTNACGIIVTGSREVIPIYAN